MSSTINKECILCLEVVLDSNFELINEIARGMLKALLIKVDLDTNEEYGMCCKCSEALHQSFEFKSLCLLTEDIITPYVRDNLKYNLWDIYVKEKGNEHNTNCASHEICRFCMEYPKNGIFVYLKDTDKFLVRGMIQKFLPEMDMDAIEQEPIICETCQTGLQNYFSFVRKCYNIFEEQDTIDEFKIEITDNEIKMEESDNESAAGSNTTLQDEESTYHDTATLERHLCQICNSAFKSQKTLYQHMSLHKSPSEVQMYKCTYATNCRQSFKHHALVHKDESEVQIFGCAKCTFETKCRYQLTKHMKIHSDIKMYKCNICPFETKHSYSIKKHMKYHQDPCEVPAYKCPHCSFQAQSLGRHLLLHKPPNNQTHLHQKVIGVAAVTDEDKSTLRKHGSLAAEEPKITCPECSREVATKQSLKIHMLMHKLNSEMPWYPCKECTYKAKDKRCIGEHMLTHGKQNMFTCDVCTYVTNSRQAFNQHALVHKDASEVQMFGCANCTYETKYKYQLTQHMTIHSFIKLYRCYICSFETKCCDSLRKHMKCHQDPCEVLAYKCNHCSFKAKSRFALTRHLILHQKVVSVAAVADGVKSTL